MSRFVSVIAITFPDSAYIRAFNLRERVTHSMPRGLRRTALQHEAVWPVEQVVLPLGAGAAGLLEAGGLLEVGVAVAIMATERTVMMDLNCILTVGLVKN